MALFYNQASTHRLGVALVDALSSGKWTEFDAAVAWVRRSGTRHLLPALREFLASGGIVRFVIGIDIENTSVEGLEDLLSLTTQGDCQTTIYHNEASVTFHPKIYLLRGNKSARLIVGSNNLTEPGLFTNTEASLELDVATPDDLIDQVLAAMESWRDATEGLAIVLDGTLLKELEENGYVSREAVLARRRRESAKKRGTSPSSTTARKLFKSKAIAAPAPPEGAASGLTEEDEATSTPSRPQVHGPLRVAGHPASIVVTNALIMRVRPARGTQVQIPIPLRKSAFFAGAMAIISGHDSRRRGISETRPERSGRKKINTFKVEMPETDGMTVPVVRLDRSPQGIIYYTYEASSTQGRPILQALKDGRKTTPPTTVLTRPSDPVHATWYRFI